MRAQDLTGRLRGLLIRLDNRLADGEIDFLTELIDASEFGLALETVADFLSEDWTPITEDERADMLTLVSMMGMDGRVQRALELCPPDSH